MTAFRSGGCALLGRGAGAISLLGCFWVACLWLVACDGEESGGQVTCAEAQLACGGVCADIQIDTSNCGGCNLSCPAGVSCAQGLCRDANGTVVAAFASGPVSCAEGRSLCGTTCADPMTSDDHCGTCGNACADGQVCDLGACRDIGSSCPMGRALCGTSCVDLTSDPNHCGSCDAPCAGGSCVAGACSCPIPETACKLGCTNLATDTNNCGACGRVCADGQLCNGGSCECGPAQTLCPSGCVDLSSSVDDCGSCGNACTGGQLCSAGTCACPSGLDLCGGECVDLTSSDDHCGSCGTLCTGGHECTGGSCVCPPMETDCDGQCADLQADAANCGMCGNACRSDEVCAAGACACPEGATSCDDTCVDTMTSVDHCGGCGMACFEGQLCNAGTCECPEELTECEEACVDAQSDAENCGSCGNACTGGQVCQAGACECPEGTSLCDGQCIDTATDPLNCGACGTACGLGEMCNDSNCQGGGLGDDGCEGVAHDLTISKVSLYQTVELPLMEGGQEPEHVDVVAGRDTLVRVFVSVGAGWDTRQLSARLFLDDGTERFTLYTSAPQTISRSSENSNRDSTFEFMIEGEQLREGSQYAVEVVECGEAPEGDSGDARYPESGGASLNAVTAGGLRIHLVPLRVNGREPSTSDEVLEQYRAGFMATYPIDDVTFTVSEVYDLYDAEDWEYNLEGLRQLRLSEDPDPAVYYYGILRPTENIIQFCGYGCTAGIGYVPQGNGPYAESGRVSMGLAYDDEESIRTMLHEVGHNHGRNHAPCAPRGSYIAGVDPYYPYDNAAIGVVGYDIRHDRLISPDAPDMMAYCDDPWFSDYTYAGLLRTVQNVNNTRSFVVASAERQGDFVTLLVGSTKPPRWFPPRYGTVAEGAPVQVEILDAAGAVVEVVVAYRNDMADVAAFSLDVPVPQAGWDAVRIDGVGTVSF